VDVVSRSPISCPSCGAALADKRRNGAVAVRNNVTIVRITGAAQTLRVTCPDCGTSVDWFQIRVVLFKLYRA
jgi:endogenous inhibitor of DNA gyrase (YacG/DUF329 family)